MLDGLPDISVAGDIGARKHFFDGILLQLVGIHDAAQFLVAVRDGRLVGRGAPVVGVDEGRVAVVGRCEFHMALGFGLHHGRERGDEADVGSVGQEGRRGVLVDHLRSIGGQARVEGALAFEDRVREAQRAENVAVVRAQQTAAVLCVALAFDGGLGGVVVPLPDAIYTRDGFVFQDGVVVVVQILAHFGNVLHDRDVEFSEAIRGTYTRQHEELWTVDCARCDDDFLGVDGVHLAGQGVVVGDAVGCLIGETDIRGPGVVM